MLGYHFSLFFCQCFLFTSIYNKCIAFRSLFSLKLKDGFFNNMRYDILSNEIDNKNSYSYIRKFEQIFKICFNKKKTCIQCEGSQIAFAMF